MNYLLVLKHWIPNTLLYEYEFSSCAIWVHIHGLPCECNEEDIVRKAASTIGEVQEIRMEPFGFTSYRIGKARVHFTLTNQLSPVM